MKITRNWMHTGFNSLWCSSTRYWIQTTSCRQAVKLRYVHGMTQCYDWISRHQIIYLRSVFFRDNIYEYRWRRQGIFSARLVLINVFPIRGRITFCPKQSRAVHPILIYSSKRLIGKRQIRSNWEWSLFSINHYSGDSFRNIKSLPLWPTSTYFLREWRDFIWTSTRKASTVVAIRYFYNIQSWKNIHTTILYNIQSCYIQLF